MRCKDNEQDFSFPTYGVCRSLSGVSAPTAVANPILLIFLIFTVNYEAVTRQLYLPN